MTTQPMTTEERERAAYLAGDTRVADLLARIAELEAERDALEEKLDEACADSLTQWEKYNGNPDQYKEFFYDCFTRLNGYYPDPSVMSDYDKSVIFDAILRGEGRTRGDD